MRRILIRTLTVALTVYGAMFFCNVKQDDHTGHDHGDHGHVTEGLQDGEPADHADNEAGDHGDHEGHDHGDNDTRDHDVHGESNPEEHGEHDHGSHGQSGAGVTLDPNAQQIAGIRTATVSKQLFSRTLELPGRVGFNEDRLVHISPRFGGVIREVHVAVGSYVKKGSILAVMENNATLSTYQVPAPLTGTVIEKHAALGESVEEDRELFIVADLSRVWANCDVYASDLNLLRTGMRAVVSAINGSDSAEAAITYIAPVINERSSTGYARIILDNTSGTWRPGMFIRARVTVTTGDTILSVEKDAVQVVNEEEVLFIPGPSNSFFSRPVSTGRRTEDRVELLSGIAEGETYVAEGAFELKATLVTSGMDPHAGHGH